MSRPVANCLTAEIALFANISVSMDSFCRCFDLPPRPFLTAERKKIASLIKSIAVRTPLKGRFDSPISEFTELCCGQCIFESSEDTVRTGLEFAEKIRAYLEKLVAAPGLARAKEESPHPRSRSLADHGSSDGTSRKDLVTLCYDFAAASLFLAFNIAASRSISDRISSSTFRFTKRCSRSSNCGSILFHPS